MALVAREQDPAPSGGQYFDVSSNSPRPINSAGQILFGGYSNIYSGVPGAVTAVVLPGQQVPAAPVGVKFGSNGSRSLNDAGATAFYSSLSGPGVLSTNNSGIWTNRTGSLSRVAREGAQAPGAPVGVAFASFGTPEINDANKIAFAAQLNDLNGQGVWSEQLGSLALVARTGDAAPGIPAGSLFTSFDQLILNNAGQVAFRASILGPGITGANNSGLWATDPTGELRVIAREGDVLPYAPSEVLTAELLFLSENWFNDRGQAAFVASGDGVGAVFVSDVAAVYPGDFNRNGVVDGGDLAVWRNDFGDAGANLAADSDRDGDVDGADFLVWQRNLGRPSATASFSAANQAVPEPSTCLLAMLAIVASCRVAHRSINA